MKKTGLLLLLTYALAGFAQQAGQTTVASAASPDTPSGQSSMVETNANFPSVQLATPTYADLYCAGFMSKQLLPDADYVAGGLHTPNTTKYTNGDIIYLAGQGYQPGAQYTIVRELYDVNRFESYPGQHALESATGQPYSEVGRIKILDTRSKNAIAQVEFSCDSILPGDIAIPFAEKTPIPYHPPIKFDRFAPPSGRLSGRIVMAKDFDTVLGTGMKVYMNVGANQGVKVGDYFRAVRSYNADFHNPVDALSFDAPVGEDTQKKQPSYQHGLLGGAWMGKSVPLNVSDLPRRAVGEVVVIGVTPTTATGMITFALEDVHIGDGVELSTEQ
ncbi:MAG TPA: hypothetical protein VFI95_20930 [Terriglobales bacterium]|nr:hypothetical protein [Terriglobales bacterium]